MAAPCTMTVPQQPDLYRLPTKMQVVVAVGVAVGDTVVLHTVIGATVGWSAVPIVRAGDGASVGDRVGALVGVPMSVTAHCPHVAGHRSRM